MNKFTKLTTALCLATAFCGMCTGCANNIKEEEAKKAGANVQTVAVAQSEHRVILSPGLYFSGSTKKLNTIASGATALTAAEADAYFAENAFFATVAAGEALPDAVTERAGTTFAGWTYALDGVVIKVDTMSLSLDSDLYLYAKWEVDGSVIPGGNPENPDIPVTPVGKSVTVNGKTMTKNPENDKEYMILAAEFEAGEELVFKNGEDSIAIADVEASSTGLTYSGGKVLTEKAGKFDLYLKQGATSWTLYGKRHVSAEEIDRNADDVTANNCYLVGNIAGTDAAWDNWQKKGFKTTLADGYYELTIKLTANDNVKFVKIGSTLDTQDWWSSTLKAGYDSTAIKNANDNDKNLIVQKSGTFTFKVNVTSHVIEFTYSA